ncbi:uncharacterized protein LOC116604310 [Nematostella vectensis]|uniref:uncharacterized protein LOC116604310 n=1 Tax=Nematostella vectensis TaxID=45351 RepID=UPI0013905AB4|nr:uncharacterized protein LOC116604310 [Nematostella vectensis]
MEAGKSSEAVDVTYCEADVQKYCEVYIDQTKDVALYAVNRRVRKPGKKVSREEVSKERDTDNSEITEYGDPGKSSNSLKLTKQKRVIRVHKERCLDAKIVNPNEIRNKKELIKSDASLDRSKFESEHSPNHVTNSTTLPILSRDKQGERTTSVGDGGNVSPIVLNGTLVGDTTGNENRHSPSKTSHNLTNWSYEDETSKSRTADVTTTETSDASKVIVQQNSNNSQNLASCLRNANSEIFFSDASSNDSGFASTATVSCNLRSVSTSKKDGGGRNNSLKRTKCKSSSPRKLQKITTPEKSKLETQSPIKVDVSLSPPALVIKRQNNTWQVETKEHETSTTTTKRLQKSLKKAKIKLFLAKSAQTKQDSKQAVENVPEINKGETNRGQNGAVKRKKRAWKQILRNPNICNGNTTNLALECKVSVDEKNPRVNGLVNATMNSKPEKTSNSVLTNTLNSRILQTRKRKNKAYRNFKLMSMFPAFPTFNVKDCDLSMEYSMAVSHTEKPPAWHPIWKWHLGAPVVKDKS